MNKPFDTLSEAMNSLKQRGYNSDFNLHPEWIECVPMNLKFGPSQFHVDAPLRRNDQPR